MHPHCFSFSSTENSSPHYLRLCSEATTLSQMYRMHKHREDTEAPAEAAEATSRRTNEGTSKWENSGGAAATWKLQERERRGEGKGGCRAPLTQQIKAAWGRVSVCLHLGSHEGVSQREAWWETAWKSWALMRPRLCWVWDPQASQLGRSTRSTHEACARDVSAKHSPSQF